MAPVQKLQCFIDKTDRLRLIPLKVEIIGIGRPAMNDVHLDLLRNSLHTFVAEYTSDRTRERDTRNYLQICGGVRRGGGKARPQSRHLSSVRRERNGAVYTGGFLR